MERIILFIFVWLLSHLTLLAQTRQSFGTIQGLVVNEHQKPVEFATVSLQKTDLSLIKTSLTNQQGLYSFDNLTFGHYHIQVSVTGYKAFASDTIVVKDSAIIQLTAQLSIRPAGLQGVVVTAKKPFIERKIDKLVLNVENSSLAAGSTAMEVLEKAPGVSVDKGDNISLQGKEGVLVLLDGKPTYMSNADLANFLRSMQSSQIETIELITNPSAKYDAAGSSGIINIRTKKNKSLGANGSITAGAGYGETWKYNGNLSANYRNQKINLFGNYTHSNNRNKRTIDIERSSNLNGEDTYFSQWGHSERNNRNHNFKAGLDYYLNSKNTVGVLVTGYNNTANEVSGNYTQIGKSRHQSDSAVDTKSSIRGLNKNMAYNINYRSVLDSLGQELTIDADYSHFTSKDRSAYDNYYLHPQGGSLKDPYFMKNTTPSTISIKAFKADYVYPYSREMKLEMGVKSSWVKTGNDLWFEELIGGAWQNNSSRSNRFIYDEKINAAYINVSRAFKATSIQTGLRAEHTSSTGNSVTTGKIVKRRYLDFFPSVFVHQTLSEKNTLSFSYSRRVDRPNYQSLNPFVYFLDQYTYEQGNPFLNPQYTHSLEMTYAYKRKYSATVGYNLTRAVMMEVILPDTSNKALYQTTLNLDQQRFYNLTLNAPVRISKWWNTNSNITLFHMSFKAPDLKGLELNAGKSGLIVTSNHNFSIAEGFTGEVTGNYTSPLVYGTLKVGAQYNMDIGVGKSFADKKMNLKFSVSDVFNTRTLKVSSTLKGLDYNLVQKNETRIFRLTLNYRFGNSNMKPASTRSTGLENEQNRIKNK